MYSEQKAELLTKKFAEFVVYIKFSQDPLTKLVIMKPMALYGRNSILQS